MWNAGMQHLFVALLVLVAFASVESRTKTHRKGHRRNMHEQAEAELEAELANELETNDDLLQGLQDQVQIDPCTKKRCRDGRICKITEEGEAKCICIPECPVENEPRRKVCSNYNNTWGSDCELSQMRCWCKTRDDRCIKNSDVEHENIQYFGACKQIEECTEDQMSDFPRRMREWLSNIMRDMADREELSPHYIRLERSAERNFTRLWNTAAIWKFCDLDTTDDRSISIHELFPIRAPLMALEHCIAPFLQKCDANKDHNITLDEWVTCLDLTVDDIDLQCEQIRRLKEDEFEEDDDE